MANIIINNPSPYSITTSNFNDDFETHGWKGLSATSYFEESGIILVAGKAYPKLRYVGPSNFDTSTGEILILKSGDILKKGTIYYIKKPNNENTSATFSSASFIKRSFAGKDYIYSVRNEIDSVYNYAIGKNKKNPTYEEFQPYEPINLEDIGITITEYSQKYSSSKISDAIDGTTYTCSSWEDILNHADSISGYPVNGKFTEEDIGNVQITATFNSTTFTWDLVVLDFTNEIYTIEEKMNADFKIYQGKVVDNKFLNSFKVVKTRSNDYYSISIDVYDCLELNKMSTTILENSNAQVRKFTFDYSFDNKTITKSIDYNLVFIIPYEFGKIIIKNKYELGNIINLDNIEVKGALVYQDLTTLSLADIDYLSNPYVGCTLGNSRIYRIDDNTPAEFTMSYLLRTKYFGTLYYTFPCYVEGKSDSYIDSIVLANAKTNFKYNEILDFGAESQLLCYNDEGKLLNTISYSDFSSTITEVDPRYGKIVNYENGFFIDEPLVLVSKAGTKSINHEIKFSFSENTLILDTSNMNKLVYIDDNFVDFSYEGLVAKIRYHNQGKIEEKNISLSNLVFSHDNIDTTIDTKYYNVVVSTTYLGQTVSGTIKIQCEKIRPVRIEVIGVEDNEKYYDNNLDKFHYPKGISVKMYYNNSSSPIDVNMASELSFYRTQEMTLTLNENSIVKNDTQSSIYFRHKIYSDLIGFYNISFKVDKVTSIILKEEVNIVLGNTLNSLRANFKLQASYQSGLQQDDDFKLYGFKNKDYIMSEQAIVITYDENEYELDSSLIRFTKPKISKIVPDFSKINTSFNNETDSINVKNVKLYVHYENASYVHEVNTYKKVATANNEFCVYCSDLIDYSFDGSQKISLNMNSEYQKEISLVFSVFNIFDTLNTENNAITLGVSILEITDIVGISLVKAYTEYNVGDKFLDSFDDTEILIYYKNSTGQQRKLQIKLNSGFSAINITPLKNTTFYKTDRAKIVKITAATNSQASLEYTIQVNSKMNYTDTNNRTLRVIKQDTYTYGSLVLNDKYLIVDDINTQVVNGIRTLRYDVSIEDIEVYGYLADVYDITKNARVILFKDYIPPIAGENNIVVKYPCYVEGNADYINKCHFGHLFGNNNAKNRLFLSGNADYINCDWHSGAINTSKTEGESISENGDFTYFEDTSYCFYGQTDNAIVGYDIISNDKMVVLKSKSDKEPTIYYRTNGLIQAIDGAGNSQLGLNEQSLYQESYPLVIGNIGAGAVSNKSIINFNGDTLFISSDRQIDGLDIIGIIGDTQRYAYTRSYYVNPLFKNSAFDLSKITMFTNNKYLFVILKDFLLVTHFEKFNSDTKQYEWWKLDIKNVSSMFEYNEKIYYGTNDGKIFRLENGLFQDISKLFVGKGGSILASEGDKDNMVTVSKEVINQLSEENTYYFKPISLSSDETTFMYYQLATINNVNSNCDLYIDVMKNTLEIVGQNDYDRISILRNMLNEKTNYYLNEISAETNSLVSNYYRKYKLKPYLVDDVSRGEMFNLIDVATGEEVDLKKLFRATLCAKLDGESLIQNIYKEKAQFKLFNEYGEINLVRYSNQSVKKAFKAEIKCYSNVKAYYITAPFTLGNLMYDKTIWGWTLTNDTNIKSYVEVCQALNDLDIENMRSLVGIYKSDFGFDLNKVDFEGLNFEKYIIPHKYTFYRPLRVPFICFGFRNYEGTNCVLSSMQIIYTVPIGSVG